jgi:hypothetical protein
MEPLLDAIVERLGSATENEKLEAAHEHPWSPL